jgi:hypothetical protein
MGFDLCPLRRDQIDIVFPFAHQRQLFGHVGFDLFFYGLEPGLTVQRSKVSE